MNTANTPHRSRATRPTALLLAAAMAFSVLVAASPRAGAQVAPAPVPADPPITGHSVASFPSREFVSVAGYPETTTSATIEVFRGNTLIGRAPGLVPGDDPLTPQFEGTMEVNHPGEPCWGPLVGTDGATSVTPNITGGDVVRVTYTYTGPLGEVITAADQMNVGGIELTVPAEAPGAEAGFGPDTVVVKGNADDGRGRPLDIRGAQVEIRTGADRFDRNGTAKLLAGVVRDAVGVDGLLAFDPIDPVANPNGTRWTATFTGLSALDVLRAVSGASAVIEANGATATTIHEGPGGPEGGCTPYPGSPGAPLPPPLDAPVASFAVPQTFLSSTAVSVRSAVQQVTLRNTGAGATAELRPAAFSFAGTNPLAYRVVANTCIGQVVPVGGSCTFDVAVEAPTAGIKDASLVVLSNSAHGAAATSLTGLVTETGAVPAPYLVVRPSSMDLGTSAVGNITRPHTATVTNVGDAAATAPTVTSAGTHATNFTAQLSDLCATALTPGGQCAMSVRFTPAAVGLRQATAQVADPGAPTTADLALTGIGLDVANVIAPVPAGKEMGTFPGREFVSAAGFEPDSYSVQVVRHGEVVSQATDITPVDNPTTPDFEGFIEINHPGEPCWERVTPDLRAFDRVRIVNSAGTAWETTVHGVEAFASPTDPSTSVVQVNENTVEVHGRALGEDGARLPVEEIAFEFVSGSANPFEVNGRRALGAPGDGVITYDPVSPANPDGTRWTARFTGLRGRDVVRAMFESEQAAIWGAAGETERTINEFGATDEGGCVPKLPDVTSPVREAVTGDTLVTPVSAEFPPRTDGTTADRVLNIRNSGPAPLNVAGFLVRGANPEQFAVAAETCTTAGPIAPEASCSVTVRFTAAGAPGLRSAQLAIDDDVAGTKVVPLNASVSATPVPSLSTSVRSITFEDTAVASTSTVAVTVTNDGQEPTATAPVTALLGPDAATFATTGCALPLAVGESCELSVAWTPARVGSAAGALELRTPQGELTEVRTVLLKGYSGVTADGYNDPPVGHTIEVFSTRDYVAGSGYAENEMVTVQVMRPDADGALTQVGIIEQLVPQDNPATPLFDGIVEVNGEGTACWSTAVPDIRPGDVVRMTAYDAADTAEVPVPTAKDQTYAQDVEVLSGAIQVLPQAVSVVGRVADARGGALPDAGQLEVRIVARGPFSTGFSSLRTGRDGLLTVNPDGTWVATFGSLTPADITLARSFDPKVLWLGRSPEAGVEATHMEWNETPGAQTAGCPNHAMGELEFANEPAVPAPVTNVGFSGVGLPGQTATVPVRNVGVAPTTISDVSVVGLHAGDFSVVGGTCPGATVPAGGTCTLAVQLHATALGSRHATLRVVHSGTNNVEHHGVTGTGITAPTLATVAPSAAGVGTRVVLRGTSFSGLTGVTFGGVPGTGLTFIDDTSASVVVPQLAAFGPADVVLTTVAGSSTLAGGLDFLPNPPTVTAVRLPAAPVVAGRAVTLVGTGFDTLTSVSVEGTQLTRDTTTVAPAVTTGFRLEADGTLSVLLPAGAPAQTRITLTGPGGTTISTPVAVVQPPRVTVAAPVSGRIGSIVTFTGTNLGNVPTVLPAQAGVTAVRFTAANAAGFVTATAVTRVNATTLRVTVPAGALPGPITLVGPAGTSTFTGFNVLAAPVVQQIVGEATVSGPNQTAIGRQVTVRGVGFAGVTGVTVGGVRASAFTVVSPTEIRATVAARTPAGNQRVAVSTGGGTGTSPTTVTVTVVPAATITAFTPLSGRVGAVVTVTGANLQFVNEVRLATRPVTFTRVGAGAAQRLTFTVPVGGLGGAVEVITLAGSTRSVQAFRVTL